MRWEQRRDAVKSHVNGCFCLLFTHCLENTLNARLWKWRWWSGGRVSPPQLCCSFCTDRAILRALLRGNKLDPISAYWCFYCLLVQRRCKSEVWPLFMGSWFMCQGLCRCKATEHARDRMKKKRGKEIMRSGGWKTTWQRQSACVVLAFFFFFCFSPDSINTIRRQKAQAALLSAWRKREASVRTSRHWSKYSSKSTSGDALRHFCVSVWRMSADLQPPASAFCCWPQVWDSAVTMKEDWNLPVC